MQNYKALHFIGFRDERYWAAVKVWGHPDFVHQRWDHRAKAELAPGDVVIFAVGSELDEPCRYAYDDSSFF